MNSFDLADYSLPFLEHEATFYQQERSSGSKSGPLLTTNTIDSLKIKLRPGEEVILNGRTKRSERRLITINQDSTSCIIIMY